MDVSGEELITDEVYDFDLPLTPNSCGSPDDGSACVRKTRRDEDDEVFFGPVGHKEKCVSVKLDEENKENDDWTALTAEELAQVVMEAKLVAQRLQNQSRSTRKGKKTPKTPKTPVTPKTPKSSRSLRSKKFHLDVDISDLGVSKLENSPLLDSTNTIKQAAVKKDKEKTPANAAVNHSTGIKDSSSANSKPGSKLVRGTNIRRTFTKTSRPEVVVRQRTHSSSSYSSNASNVSNVSTSSLNTSVNSRLSAPRTLKVPKAVGVKSGTGLPIPSRQTSGQRERTNSGSSAASDKSNISAASAPPALQRHSLQPPMMNKSSLQKKIDQSLSKSTQNIGKSNAAPVASIGRRISGLPAPGSKTGLVKPGLKRQSLNPPKTEESKCEKPNNSLNHEYDNAKAISKSQPVCANNTKSQTTGTNNSKLQIGAASGIKPALKVPGSRLPGALPKSLLTSRMKIAQSAVNGMVNPGKGPVKGPMKATQSAVKALSKSPTQADDACATASASMPSVNGQANLHSTPIKPEKHVQPKRLLNSSINASHKSCDSTSGESVISTPGSCKRSAQRRSFLPTPNKSRLSSSGSIPPSPLRSVSVSSGDSAIASPMPNGRRKSSAIRSSPAVGVTRTAMVQHTPNITEQKQVKRSIWSPVVRRRPLSKEEEVTQCTKRTTAK